MDLSPLQLKHYHFVEFNLKASESVKPKEIETDGTPYPLFVNVDFDVEVMLGLTKAEPDPHMFAVRLTAFGTPKSNSKFPYQFSATVEGVFEIAHDADLDERKRLVIVNGAGVLYSAVREQLLALSSRSSHGAMLLPTADFRSLFVDKKTPKVEKQLVVPKGLTKKLGKSATTSAHAVKTKKGKSLV